MRITAMPLEWLRCGVSVRKAFFGDMVSRSAVCVVVVALRSHQLLHLYYTSIFQAFDAGDGNISEAAQIWRLDL
jgi:hypothetical protein